MCRRCRAEIARTQVRSWLLYASYLEVSGEPAPWLIEQAAGAWEFAAWLDPPRTVS